MSEKKYQCPRCESGDIRVSVGANGWRYMDRPYEAENRIARCKKCKHVFKILIYKNAEIEIPDHWCNPNKEYMESEE